MKRSYDGAARRRDDTRAELTAASSATKSAIAKVLQILQQRGYLNDSELGCDTERASLTEATQQHGKVNTLYGTVVQTIGFKTHDGGTLKVTEVCCVFSSSL